MHSVLRSDFIAFIFWLHFQGVLEVDAIFSSFLSLTLIHARDVTGTHSGHVRARLLGGGCEELLGEGTEWSLSALEPLQSLFSATEALTCISAPWASSWLTSCELAGRGEIDGWDAWFCVTLAMVTSALLTTPKPLTVWITTNCGKFWKRWESQTTWPASWETCTQVKKQQSDWTWNNRLVPNWERSMSRLYIVTLLI